MKYPVNEEIMRDMLNNMPESKKTTLSKALDRNLVLTSSRVLAFATLTVYKEGWLLTLEGTRCGFKVFARDNDGEFEFIRKPNDNKLHKLYDEHDKLSESDFINF